MRIKDDKGRSRSEGGAHQRHADIRLWDMVGVSGGGVG